MEIFNHMFFVKPTATTWTFVIDFIYVEGDMDWNSEMSELYGDVRQIAPERSAGGVYFQPTGTFRQVGGIDGEDL